jgi:hypothetical protein
MVCTGEFRGRDLGSLRSSLLLIDLERLSPRGLMAGGRLALLGVLLVSFASTYSSTILGKYPVLSSSSINKADDHTQNQARRALSTVDEPAEPVDGKQAAGAERKRMTLEFFDRIVHSSAESVSDI